MIELADINDLDRDAFVDRLGGVFEHAAWVARAAYDKRPFATVSDLHGAMMAAVRDAPANERLTFLNGHPELAGPEARARAMTADSAQEQGSAGLDRLSDADADAFDRLNAAYRQRFGFPFIVAVRGRDLRDIRVLFEQRLGRARAEEEATALDEIAAITRMRLDRLVRDPAG
ncbi:2-oxo-4-hydroxy-4-carboxy-5-ureidoimidazoline decarboxylase [Methylobacterium mesophilicum SR1.6/6]|uniref:2-oxo-4-hydroxy-4-carboxy-5-ureidoimidazoline decarboxylase n=1 Tax=Methylobacterium mesophilicum SR1.6/6 TaxID=908290 RepID=A0A6B9FFM6_9HYPH|nr:2-oxo-4-hydroxy-4-carboxy-5-ureidoimidazoline decarboxylase [Methylobacterium mesophilicum]QGY01660.1 2-oxo-4-hydroxy-4-carboxy-5-ureidoimidazoline decarboxylase [Methylobacterium mesophilicum SR1.6/6]